MRFTTLMQVFRLSLADIIHERTLTLCLVCSLAAVLSPLLILLGLKGGIIYSMMQEISGDPIHREIVPEGLLPFKADENWISAIRARPEVEFILPNLRGLGMTVDVRPVTRKQALRCTARPSGTGDPLLGENGVRPPQEGEAVLSQSLAAELGMTGKGQIEITVLRQSGDRFEPGRAVFKVNGVLPARATDQNVVWLPLGYLLDVEAYIAGGAVPRLGWKGHHATVSSRFDGVIVATAREISPDDLPRLMQLSGLGKIEPFPREKLRATMGLIPSRQWYLTLWRAIGNTLSQDNIIRLQTRLDEMGMESALIPWLEDFNVEISQAALGPVAADRLSVCILDSAAASVGGFDPVRRIRRLSSSFFEALISSHPSPLVSRPTSPLQVPPDSQERVAFVGVDNRLAMQNEVLLRVPAAGSGLSPRIRTRLHAVDWLPANVICLPRQFAGQLKNAVAEGLSYDEDAEDFQPAANTYRDFRLYARSVDDIASLVAFFGRQEIPVRSNLMAVTHIKTMESFLDRLYYLIAGISAVAAFLAMMTSLYANVERKRVVIAYLELVGVEQNVLFFFSIFQAVCLALLAAVLAAGIYLAFDGVVDRFVADIAKTRSVCRLTSQQALISFACLMTGAVISSFFSAIQMLRLDPSEYLRQE